MSKIGDATVSVFIDQQLTSVQAEMKEGTSFEDTFKKTQRYKSDFLRQMSDRPLGVVMRDSSLYSYFKDDVKLPEFYDSIGVFKGMEVT